MSKWHNNAGRPVLADCAGSQLVAAATVVDAIRTAANVEAVRPAIDSAFLGSGIGSDTLGILIRFLKRVSLVFGED